MDVWMNEWMDGWIWIDGCMVAWIDGDTRNVLLNNVITAGWRYKEGISEQRYYSRK